MTDPNVSLLASSEYRHLPGGFHLSTLEEGSERPPTRQHHSTRRRRGTQRCQTSLALLALLGVEHHTRNQPEPPGKLPAWSSRVGAEHPSTGVTPGGETPGTMRGTLPASPAMLLLFLHPTSKAENPPPQAQQTASAEIYFGVALFFFFFFPLFYFFPYFREKKERKKKATKNHISPHLGCDPSASISAPSAQCLLFISTSRPRASSCAGAPTAPGSARAREKREEPQVGGCDSSLWLISFLSC